MADDPSERGSNSTRDHYPTITRAQESWRQGNGEIEPKKDSQTGVYCHSGELRVVFNDEDMVVLDKPSGLRTVPGRPTTNGQELESRAEARIRTVPFFTTISWDSSRPQSWIIRL